MQSKLAAGAPFPPLAFATTSGERIHVDTVPGWRLLVVYRGKHCPLCKTYLKTLDGLGDEAKAAGISVMVVSADPKEKADADVAEFGWRFPVGFGLDTNSTKMIVALPLIDAKSGWSKMSPWPKQCITAA